MQLIRCFILILIHALLLHLPLSGYLLGVLATDELCGNEPYVCDYIFSLLSVLNDGFISC